MNTSALILMLASIVGVTVVALYFLFKVLNKKSNFNQDAEQNSEDE